MLANKVYVIGLTGGIGCGKSEAAAFLEQLGAVHVDADAISRELTAPGGAALQPIREKFGDGVFAEDGTLDRAALGDVVFESEANRLALEAIIHPMVQSRAWNQIESAIHQGERVIVLNVPLLYETGMDALCDETWVMSASEETQLARVMARGLTEEQARKRIQNQMSTKERNSRATRVINTDRMIERTHAELQSMYQQILKKLD
ncbi:MAG: dephospho-CoA kinase [Christensenellales bacterium]|nr:dephospho-CoA kinase [Christensenellales bacterium]